MSGRSSPSAVRLTDFQVYVSAPVLVRKLRAVVDDPSLVNSDPFGEGWLVKLRVDGSAPAELIDREAYLALTGGEE